MTALDATAVPDDVGPRRGVRLVAFSVIGGAVFLAGLGLQALLTGGWHVLPVASYLIQAVASVQASFVLNRWLTWRDRSAPIWRACARFNAQKAVTVALTLALYAGLIHLGMNYLVANVLLTAVFTVVNYVASDRLVFVPGKKEHAEAAAPPLAVPSLAVPSLVRHRPLPTVSVVIPCRDNERTIRAVVQSLLEQDYSGLREIILVGSPGDSTWTALTDIADPRLILRELETPPEVRDANLKRDAGIKMTSGDLIALVDSDVVLPGYWVTQAVAALEDSNVSCVTGGMRSIHDTFWGRYTDDTVIGAKTPRIARSYTVTSGNFGTGGRKPPITANAMFTRDLYKHCPIDPFWSHGSYEDYEWFWRVARAGYEILVCTDLFGWHHHRRGLRTLAREYRRSSNGCAYFIRAHLDSPLAQRRLRQAVILPVAAIAGTIAAAAAAADGYGAPLAVAMLACAAALIAQQVVRSRRLESLAYPAAGLAFGLVFTTGLVTDLIRRGSYPAGTEAPPDDRAAGHPHDALRRHLFRRFLLHPLTAICAAQATLSCTLIWSNTVFGDEANYLWAGHLELARWLHGAPVPQYLLRFSGSPVIYPPLGALADNIGGLAGARILSLVFMLGATVLLYLTASRLAGRAGAVFAAALWALSEPALRLAFATYDPLSVFLTALSAWVAVQAGYRHRRGELVAASAAALVLANATAYSGIVIDPVLMAFAFLVWLPRMRARQASYCTAWLAGGWAVIFGLVMTAAHSWAGTSAVFHRTTPDHQSPEIVLNDIWTYGGLIIVTAVIGAVVALAAERRPRAALLALLGGTIFVVPAAQLHAQTGWSLDKHLAYGIWFAAIAAGYGCSKLFRWLPGATRKLLAICCAAAFAYPAVNNWELAWNMYHSWPDARSFVAAFTPVVARSHGFIDVSGQQSIAEYYTPQGRDWKRWDDLLFHPAPTQPGAREHYYAAQLDNGKYGVIALFYAASFSAERVLPGSSLLSPHGSRTYQQLLGLTGINSGGANLPVLTQALEKSPEYRLVATGPYDTSNLWGNHVNGVYAIWQKKAQQKKAQK
jgi:glycosyltransferase involved in cell wall biosynthesis/putative flippase GtrA